MPASKVQLTGGNFQDSEGNVLANGYLEFTLSQDGSVAGVGNICSGVTIKVTLDGSGSVSASQFLWGNDQILPLNTFYRVTGYTAQGQPAWGPNSQQVLGNGGTFSVGSWIPNQVVSWIPPTVKVALKHNGTLNDSQAILDLTAAPGVTITDAGSGVITIGASAPSAPILPDNGYFGIVTPGTPQGGWGYNSVGDIIGATGGGAGIVSTTILTQDTDSLRGPNWRMAGTGTGVSGFEAMGGRTILWGNRITKVMSRWSLGPTQSGGTSNQMFGLSDAPTGMNANGPTPAAVRNALCFIYTPIIGSTWRIYSCNASFGTVVNTSVPVGPNPQKLEIDYTPGVNAKFLVDGVLAGTLTTTLPLTTVKLAWFFMINPYGNGAICDGYLEWVYWQQLY